LANMSNFEGDITLEYRGKRYTVAVIKYAGYSLPILLDREVYKVIKKLDKKWYVNDKNHVYCIHYSQNLDGSSRPTAIYLHEIVVKITKHANLSYPRNRPIIHINNIHFDNRIENLQFDTPNKDHLKNTKKKNRTINLSKYGIKVEELPTYMWYLKPDSSHGDRFTIEIPGHIHWRTTASKKVSLRYKLEEAKKYLRHLKNNRPDIFESFSMNGDMTSHGIKLYKEYNVMIAKAGFVMKDLSNDKTDDFLRQTTTNLSTFEIYLLLNFDPAKGSVDVNALQKEYQSMMG
jgi:hypothetical protein